MNSKIRQRSIKRIVASIVLIFTVFMVLFGRLVYLQVFSADELSEKQTYYMTKDMAITASRGDIYDRNLNILAKDATCSKISVYPNNIEKPEEVALFLSEKLGLSYDSVYKKVSNRKMDYVAIKRGVDNQTALAIRNENITGVVITEDKKRYYTDSTSAQYILGFTGADHYGLFGIEAVYNDMLEGVDGMQTLLADSEGRKIESFVNIKKESIPGNHLVLTTDSVIQYYAESAVYEAYLNNKPKRVFAIVSNPKTGEILAMAAYPSYNLSDAWTLNTDFINSYKSDLSDKTLSEKQLEMWRNPFTSFIYEPGSTFKVITVSSALEEGSVTLGSTFNCSGFLTVGGVKIKCHIYPRGHGHQNLTKAVVNSCNPSMMKIAMAVGPEKFYQYLYDYGFGHKTGIDLDGEEAGILYKNQDVNIVNFVTIAFGQGIGVTPVQMTQAMNAAINGGHLYEPQLVKSIIDAQTGEVQNIDIQEIRQVVSEETSKKMRGILNESAASTSGLDKDDQKKYKIGGKTGTAQKIVNGRYAAGKYVASFYGFAPYDDPQISVLVLIDEPTGSATTGSRVAAPVAETIIERTLSYLSSSDNPENGEPSGKFVIPDLRGNTLEEALIVLDTLSIPYEITGGSSGIVTSQTNIKQEYKDGMKVALGVSAVDSDTVVMPDLHGMTVQQCSGILNSLGLEMKVEGGGICVYQSVEKNKKIKPGSKVTVKFKYVE